MDSEDLDYSTQIKLTSFVIMLSFRCIYGSIVSNRLLGETPFVAMANKVNIRPT